MKKPGLINRLLTVIFMLITCQALLATNIRVSDIVIVERNDADRYIIVQFNLSWDYGFRVDDGANTNWDAAWVIMKYKRTDQTNVQWGHATLAGAGHTIPGNYTSSLGATGGVNKGIFIYPSVIFAGTAEINGVQLRWDYGEDGLDPEHEVDIRVFGIEMVYVPTGSFYVGSGGGETNRFHAGGESNTTPFQITSAPFQIGNTAGNLWATGPAGSRTAGVFAEGYPTGYNGFYMMKHKITQQAYVDFLNTLTYAQQDARINGSPGDGVGVYAQDQTANNNRRHRIKIITQGNENVTPAEYETEHPYLPVNWISPEDLLSYLDWAALRPYTEMEYEKAARGPASPVANEYAWGNRRIGAVTSIENAGTATEAPVASGFQRDITIDHTKVNENLTNFPVLVRLDEDNFDFFRCREDGFDFRFYDSEGNTLSYLRERHNFADKKAEYWVKVPLISNSQNTVITLEYGNILDAADGADPGNVWDDDFVSVWHLDEDADGAAGEYKDSKGGNDGTGTGTVANRIEGQVGLAQEFDGEGAISIADDATLDIEDFVTISGWIKPRELTGVNRTEATSADWADYHSIDNLTTAADKLAVDTGPGTGWRISNAISLDAIKKAGSSSIDWEDEWGYKVVAFTSGGVFSVPEGVTEVDVLVVGGGGSGGNSPNANTIGGGGGGAGGLVYEDGFNVSPGTNISVIIGQGGSPQTAHTSGFNGENSSFGSITALGGGGGAGGQGGAAGDGGSGGGAEGSSDWNLYGEGLQPASASGGFGNDGGQQVGATTGASGGGGAGGSGESNSGDTGGAGGAGMDYSHVFGTTWGDNGWFAGGGGGHGRGSSPSGDGGQGGGGVGATGSDDNAEDAMPNTGGGGGGGSNNNSGVSGAGGSGIVLVRYKDPQSVRIYTAINESADTPPDFDNVQIFTADGSFTVPDGITRLEVLVVGGGGGGGSDNAGGGGGGGVIHETNYTVEPGQIIAFSVGAGGAHSGTGNADAQTSGGNSTFGTLEAIGGGFGSGGNTGLRPPGEGGSGGGGQGEVFTNPSCEGAAGTPGQGHAGGRGYTCITGGNGDYGGGGGGGAGSSGSNGAVVMGGAGGMGYLSSITGEPRYYGSGGGGGGENGSGGGGGGSSTGAGAAGGQGGGNQGGDGEDDFGGGGGGSSATASRGGSGGSGVVIVRYGFATKGDPIPGINEGDDLTDKYLWVRQELSTNNATHSPELESLELEIKGEAVIAGKGEDAYQLSYYDGQLRGYINNQRVSSALTLDQYQHVAITYNGSHQRIYVNGLLTGTLALTGDINTNASNLVMGLNLEGELDEFRLSPVARSQAWLQAEYHSGTGDLVQIGGEAQNVNAVYTASGTFGGVGAGPLRVGFGATGTSSRTASGASYWGIMELSGNLWKMTIAAGSVAGREFTGLHGDGVLTEAGFFNTANWNAGTLGLRGAGFTTALDRLRVSDRNNITTLDAAGRHNNRGGRGVRTAP